MTRAEAQIVLDMHAAGQDVPCEAVAAARYVLAVKPKPFDEAMAELVLAWPGLVNASAEPVAAPVERLRATGEAAARLRCPVARRVILKTEKHWSGK